MTKHELLAVHIYDIMMDAINGELFHRQAELERTGDDRARDRIISLEAKKRRASFDLVTALGGERLEEIRRADLESGFTLVSDGWKETTHERL